MGGLLNKPVTKKSTNQGEGLGLRYGLSSMQGWRPEMEDTHDVKIGLGSGLDDWSFFAVFDGHAGRFAACFAACYLREYILRDDEFELGLQDKMPPTNHEELRNKIKNPLIDQQLNGEETPSFSREEVKLIEYLLKGENDTDYPLREQERTLETKKESNEEKEEEKSNEPVEKQKSKSSDQLPNSECSELSVHPPEDEAPKIKQDQLIQEEQKLEEKSPQGKFTSFPVLTQLNMVEKAIKSAFLRIDNKMRIDMPKDMSGCTAVCAFISPTHLFIANCGDSRAVLYDGTSAKFATEDHKPLNPKERQRIIDAGGTATQRINGTLAVSRALGDFEFKKDWQRGPCEQLVSPEPEVTIIERGPKDEFLILACDGIWDVIDNDDLCRYVSYELMIEPDLEKVGSSVLDVCLCKGSRDNMSIIIVVFETGPKVSEIEIERVKKNDEALLKIADSVQEEHNPTEFPVFLTRLMVELELQQLDLLPPGAGIEARYSLLRDRFEENLAKQNLVTKEEEDEEE